MLYSKLFPKTQKTSPRGAESVNHQLLVRAGFIDQLMAGSWTILPLGFRVLEKINDIIREELNKTGAQEMLMPLLHPREIWDMTGRWSDKDVKEIMYQFKDIHDREFGLSFTHEEIMMNLLGKYIKSYKDLPTKLYHFSTKFRNELRARSGILRGREFMMKDLYSAHVSEEDMFLYYNEVKEAYLKIFKRMGFDTLVVEAPGGVFTDKHTHEFQVLAESGENVVFYCDKCDFAQNEEIFDGKVGEKCIRCGKGEIKSSNAIEIGNIFPLGTMYSEKMGVKFTDEEGKEQPIWFASYGIGSTRLIGTFVEIFHDEKGIIWPENVAPFAVHLIGLDLSDPEIRQKAEQLYKQLLGHGVEVLFDDREDVSAGAKFADSDLIGIPLRVVVSKKTGEKLEVKKRNDSQTEFLDFESLKERLTINGK